MDRSGRKATAVLKCPNNFEDYVVGNITQYYSPEGLYTVGVRMFG